MKLYYIRMKTGEKFTLSEDRRNQVSEQLSIGIKLLDVVDRIISVDSIAGIFPIEDLSDSERKFNGI